MKDIPTFGGEHFRTWLKDFQNAMLVYDWDENDKKQAKAFRLNLVEGSMAQQWYEQEVDEPSRASWSLLLPLLKAKFDNAVEDRRSAFQVMSTTSLRDDDIGAPNGKGGMRHVDWARSLSVASQRAGEDRDGNYAFLVMNNIGPNVRSLLTARVATSSVGRICNAVETLTPTDIETVKAAVKAEQDNRDMRSKLALLERSMQPGRPAPQPTQRETSDSYSSSWINNQNVAPTEDVIFQNNTEGVEAYKRAVRAYHERYGDSTYPNPSRPYPLTPGSDPAGTNECYKCGKADHLRSQCQAPYTIPENEQRYRGSVNKAKRSIQQRPDQRNSNTTPMAKPIRWLGTEDDPRFAHLARLNHFPISPPMSDYADLPENGEGPNY